MKKGDNVRFRADGRYEARYIKSRDESGKIKYGCCYGKTYEEAVEKRELQIKKMIKPKEMNIIILGAGSHGLEVYELVDSLRIFNKICFLDDIVESENVIGKWEDAKSCVEEFPIAIVAVGSEQIRKEWTEKLVKMGYIIPTLIHPTAFVAGNARVGVGAVICARATITSGACIGRGCIVSGGTTVPLGMKLPDWSYFDYSSIKHL